MKILAKSFPYKWAAAAKVAWLVLSMAALGFALVGIAAMYRELNLPCAVQVVSQVCAERLEALEAIGLSQRLWVTLLAFGVIVELLPWFVVGGLIFWQKSRDWFGYLFSLLVILQGITVIDPAISVWAEFAFPNLTWLVQVLINLSVVLLAAWFFFPDGRLVAGWARWLVAAWLLRSAGNIFFPGTVLDATAWPEPLPVVIELSLVAALVFTLFYRLRLAQNPVSRSQIRNVILSGVFLGAMYITNTLVFRNLEQQVDIIRTGLILGNLYYLASGVFAFNILVAIFRYRLFDITIVIRKTMVYSLLTIFLGLFFELSVAVLQSIFTALTGSESGAALVLSTLAIAALFKPLRTRTQAFIDRRFYRTKYDLEQSLARFSVTARDEVDMDKLMFALLDVVNETLQPEMLHLMVDITGGKSK